MHGEPAADAGPGTARNLGFLVLRLALGAIFFAHGAQKVFGWFGGPGFEGMLGFGAQFGFPAWFTVIWMFTELLGGLLVALGVFARVAAAGLAVVMVGAITLVHAPHGFFLAPPGAPPEVGHGVEFTLALLAMALFVLLAGPGGWALGGDTEVRLSRRRRRRPVPA